MLNGTNVGSFGLLSARRYEISRDSPIGEEPAGVRERLKLITAISIFIRSAPIPLRGALGFTPRVSDDDGHQTRLQGGPERQGGDRHRRQHRHRPADGQDARRRRCARRPGVPIRRARQARDEAGHRGPQGQRGGHPPGPQRRRIRQVLRRRLPQEAQDAGHPREQRGTQHHRRVQGTHHHQAGLRDLHGHQLLRTLRPHRPPHARAPRLPRRQGRRPVLRHHVVRVQQVPKLRQGRFQDQGQLRGVEARVPRRDDRVPAADGRRVPRQQRQVRRRGPGLRRERRVAKLQRRVSHGGGSAGTRHRGGRAVLGGVRG